MKKKTKAIILIILAFAVLLGLAIYLMLMEKNNNEIATDYSFNTPL